ncbi:hypothetical protein B0T10DRAFT_217641 [Thelonectria olida]|uniref:Uncharacterized protein n=1 Tax=Thelonectria olida TaxID=1576542 RepID=A0A9P8WCQ2_9HYPO|nr:hypothetical protein B0T10DRAFT_217641 [Thelonectria olida]
MPAVSTSRLQSLQEEQPPPWAWPEFWHPALITIAALTLILVLLSILVSILWQLVCLHVTQRRGFVLVDQRHYADVKRASCQHEHDRHHLVEPKQPYRPISQTCRLEIETARQLLAGDGATAGERMPLCSGGRGSLYDTFQVPSPHAARLKFSQSMMELNGGSPLEGDNDKNGVKKAKTIHWHGVNRLNTAWAWMS